MTWGSLTTGSGSVVMRGVVIGLQLEIFLTGQYWVFRSFGEHIKRHINANAGEQTGERNDISKSET